MTQATTMDYDSLIETLATLNRVSNEAFRNGTSESRHAAFMLARAFRYVAQEHNAAQRNACVASILNEGR